MSRLGRNLSSEIGGRIWVAATGFIAAPFYMRWLGVEGFGLLGFYASIAAIANILDLGIATLMNRELARLSADRGARAEIRDLVRSFGAVSWVAGLLVALGTIGLAGPIADHFLHSSDTDRATVADAIRVMGVMLGLNLPLGFYWASLLGLQRHVRLNLINVTWATAAAGLNLLGLYLLHPGIGLFLAWQAVFLFAKMAAAQISLWRQIGEPLAARLRLDVLGRHWGFAKASFVFTLLGVTLAQTDKVVLARMLPLQDYGYYIVAATIIQGLYLLIYPFSVASFPRMSELLAAGEDQRLRETYRQVCQLLAAVVIPIAATLFFNAHAALFAWTNDGLVADQAAPLLRVMALAIALTGLLTIPTSLILAHGRLSLLSRFYAPLAILQVPAMIVASRAYGGLGAAAVWLGLNAVLIIGLPIAIEATMLKGELKIWLFQAIAPALVIGIAVPAGLSGLAVMPSDRLAAIGLLAVMTIAALGLSMVRLGWLRGRLRRIGAGFRA